MFDDYFLVFAGFVISMGVLHIIWQLYRECWDIARSRDVDGGAELPGTAPPPQAVLPVEKRLTRGDEIVFDTFVQEKAKEEGGGCVICLVEYNDGETLATITVCRHKYHADCIKAWLKEQDTCPLCRTQV